MITYKQARSRHSTLQQLKIFSASARCKRFLCAMMYFIMFNVTTVNAADYYISSINGDDSRTLQQAQNPDTPWKTIQKAADISNPGDVIYIMNGTYTRASEGVNIRRSGSAYGGYITYRNYPGHTPVIYMPKANGNWAGIQINEGVSYIIIDGLTLKGGRAETTLAEGQAVHDYYKSTPTGRDWNYIASTNTNGIFLKGNKTTLNGIHHVIIRNCHVYDFPGGGIATEIIDYVTVENNRVHSNCWYMIYAGSGISLFHPYNSDGNTSDFKLIVRNNITYDNETKIQWADQNKYSDGNGIIIDDTKNSQISKPAYTGKTLVTNNIAFDNGGSGIQAFSSENVWIVNNTGYLNSRSPHLNYANITSSWSTNCKVINNISYVRSGEPTNSTTNNVNVEYDYNVYYNGLAPAVKGPNDKVELPVFEKPSTVFGEADFRLKVGSPGRDDGTIIYGITPTTDYTGQSRPQGAGMDRGAYEHVVSVTVPQAPYYGTPYAIPGWVEPESFDKGGEGISYHDNDATNNGGQFRTTEGVDIATSTDGNYKVGWIHTGEWLEYTVNVSAAGAYNVAARVSSGSTTAGSFRIEMNGSDVSGPISVQPTGNWNTFTTVNKTISLNAGQQVMRIFITAGGFDISSFRFTAATTNPPATQVSVFTTQTPAGTDTDGPYELGMKFRSAQAGRITKIRYYKVPTETGTHIGRIWSSTGSQLTSVTFANETSSGWQTATLATPLAINANTVYIVTVTSNTAYGYTNEGLQSVITNAPLSSIADGANGVYGAVNSFPTNSWRNSNYFRDVVFEPNATARIADATATVSSEEALTTPADGSTVGKMYPNPATQDYIMLEDYPENTIVQLVTLQGYKVYEGFLHGSGAIPLNTIPNGFYIVKLKRKSGEAIEEHRLVINK